MRLPITVLTAALALLLSAGAEARGPGAHGSPSVIVFATNGNDSTGDGSVAHPYLTPGKAQTVERTVLAAGNGAAVQARAGTYVVTSTLAFTSSDNGAVWQTYPSDSPATISGGFSVPSTSWSICTTADTVCNSGSGGVYQANLGLLSGAPTDFREAYFNNLHGVRSRYPTDAIGPYPAGWSVTSGGAYTAPVNSTTPTSSWKNHTLIEIVSQQGWRTTYCKIASISGTSITMQSPCIDNWVTAFNNGVFIGSNTPAWIENAYELLLSCGQGCWYYDPLATMLYYIPRTGESMTGGGAIPVELPNVFQLITITGANSIRFEHLILDGSTWLDPDNSGHGYVDIAGGNYCVSPPPSDTCDNLSNGLPGLQIPAGVDVKSSSSAITFSHDEFQHLSGRALFFEHTTQNSVAYANLFQENAGGGISIGDPTDFAQTDPALQTSGNIAQDNQIDLSSAFEYRGASGLHMPICKGCTVTHNYTNGAYWTAFNTGWWGDLSGHDTYNANNQVTNNKSVLACKLWPNEDCGDFYNSGHQVAYLVSGDYAQGLGGNNTNFKNACFYPDGSTANTTYSSLVCDGPLQGNNCSVGGQNGGCWMYIWESSIGPLTISAGSFATSSLNVNNGTGITYNAPTTFTSGSPPSGATAIINASGIEAGVTPGP